ncbi:MAG: UvrD-helicase domain-containing protein [Planctomycetes bacterium]|nr:UvrD-helicase domain-containing protein [Planctomycetota bacterium]
MARRGKDTHTGKLFGEEPAPKPKPAKPAKTQPAAKPAGRDPFKLADLQQKALDAQANRVLSASAGTGKTHTLTAIYLDVLLGRLRGESKRDAAPLRPGEVVAVTFTEKAAAELLERARGALEDLLANAKHEALRAHLALCRDELSGAPVSTIHGYCARLLRAAGERDGVPPGFRMLEQDEADELLDDALRSAAAELLAKSGEESAALFELAREWNVSGAFGKGLLPVGRSLIHALRTLGLEPDALLDKEPEGDASKLLDGVRERVAEVPDKGKQGPKPELRALLSEPVDAGDNHALRRFCLEALPLVLTNKKPFKWAEGLGLDADLRAVLALAHAPHRAALVRYIKEALARYAKAKRAAGELDFDDLLLDARRLLEEEPQASGGAQFVLIDEFQDTNPIQWQVLERVAFPSDAARGRPRIAIVGDEKQSIYRFRGAEVRLFRDRCAEKAFAVQPLKENFRSRAAVIDFLNAFFRTVWPAQAEGFSYDQSHELEAHDAGGERHAWEGPPGELLKAHAAAENADQARWAQAQAIARRIRTMIDAEKDSPRVWDKEKSVLRTPSYKDVAVLAHSVKSLRVPLELAFAKYRVPFRMIGGVTFYTRQEVLDVLNLLAAVADPSDTLSLAGFLRSPLVQLPDGAVFRLVYGKDGAREGEKGGAKAEGFAKRIEDLDAEGLSEDDAAKFRAGAELLKELRSNLGRWTVAECIDLACRRTGFMGVLAMQPQGELAVAAVRRLIERARVFEAQGAHTFGDFAEWLRERVEREFSEPAGDQTPDLAPDLPESPDAVHVGTIHKAKGLEFPVVFVAEMGTAPRSNSDAAFFEPGHGLGLRIGIEREGLSGAADAIHAGIAEQLKAAEDEESRRKLYVALTRARDYLVLCGEYKDNRKDGTWRAYVDAYLNASENDGALPKLLVREDNAKELLDAKPPEAQAPLSYDAGEAKLSSKPRHKPDAEALSRLQALLKNVAQPPARAWGPGGRSLELPVTEFARLLAGLPGLQSYERADSSEAAGAEEISETGAAAVLPGGSDEFNEQAGLPPADARKLGVAAHAALEAAVAAGGKDAPAAAASAWCRTLARAGADAECDAALAAFAKVEAALNGKFLKEVLALPPAQRYAERALRWRLSLDGPPRLSVALSGTIDLLAQPGGAWRVVDYKLAARENVSAKVLHAYAWQVRLYAAAAGALLREREEAAADVNVGAYLYFLGDAAGGAVPLPVDEFPEASRPAEKLDPRALRAAFPE